MRRFIPGTSVLIAFEAAARLGSFSRAAAELCLSESAVSKQIAKLESFLKLRLFDRANGHFGLSEAGAAYIADVRKALDKLEADTRNAANFHMARKELEIAALPTFANKWILPRLRNFVRSHPDIVVSISGRAEPFDFYEAQFSAAVHFSDPLWKGVRQQTLFSEELIAVINPRHFPSPAWKNADFFDAPLLHKVSRHDAWKRWFEGAGIDHPDPGAGAQYDTFTTLIEAVRSGMGISLIPRLYVEKELETGELVQPHPRALKNEKTYMVILPDRDVLAPPLDAFLQWITEEARLFREQRGMEEAING